MIDWAATGNWMQAWAGFAQAAAVVFVAYKGSTAFRDWRQQKIGERKLDTAEHVLDLIYRVKRALVAVRSPMMMAASLERAEERLNTQQPTWLEGLRDEQRRRVVHSQAIYDRVNDHQQEWDELWAAMPRARWYFGTDLEAQLQRLWGARASVLAAAEARATYAADDHELRTQLDRTIWTGLGLLNGGRNEVDDEIAEAFERVEAILLPVLADTAPAR